MIKLALFILFLPLFSFVFQIFSFRRFEEKKGEWVSVGIQFVTLILSLVMLGMMLSKSDPNFSLELHQSWLDLGLFKIDLGVYIDNITVIMLVVVAIISSLVHLYSTAYMAGDVRYSRYFGFSGNLYLLHEWYCPRQ